MYPRGSNGALRRRSMHARSPIVLRPMPTRATRSKPTKPRGCEPTAKVVRTNRDHPPDFINIKVEELVGDRPFNNLDDYITQGELRALSENYKKIAGFSVADVGRR
jgi:5-methylphenazine-1-carboxylate 1-monooxygenase